MLPRFFSGLGIDVSEHHARFALVSSFGGIKKLHEVILPEGLVVDEKVVKPNELKALVAKELSKNNWIVSGPIRATVLVPESRVFSSEILLDRRIDRKTALIEAVRQAQKKIPIPFSQAGLSAVGGETVGDKIRYSVYVSPKEILLGLKAALDFPSFKMMAMEVNSKALQRFFVVSTKYQKIVSAKQSLVGIVDVGHSWTTVSVFAARGSQIFSRTIAHADLVEKVGKKAVLSVKAAERIVSTIKEVQVYLAGRQQKLSIVVLCGVEALQENVLGVCKKEKGIPFVLLGDSLQNKNLPKDLSHRFGAAIGAAYRSLKPGIYSYQHNFLNKK